MEDDKGELHEVTVPKKEGEKAAENGEAESNSTHVADGQQSSSAEGSLAAAAPSTNVVEEVKKVEKEFTLTGLTAMDRTNGKRVARAGETLYYVDAPTLKSEKRSTQFEITINPKLPADEVEKERIQWTYNTTHLAESDGKIKVEKSVAENDNAEVSVKAGVPNADEKNVKVKWVKENRNIKDFTSQLGGFFDLFKTVNKISDAAAIVVPCKVSFLEKMDRNLTFQWQAYNEEDKASRHILKHDEFTFSINAPNIASLKCEKRIGVSVFGYDLSLGELYLKFNAGANIGIVSDKIYYYENNKLKEKQTKANGGIEAKGEAGVTVGGGLKDDKGELVVGAYGGGSVAIKGGGRIEYPYSNNTNQIRIVFYIDPLMYNFTTEVKMGPLSKSFTYSEVLWDTRIEDNAVFDFNK